MPEIVIRGDSFSNFSMEKWCSISERRVERERKLLRKPGDLLAHARCYTLKRRVERERKLLRKPGDLLAQSSLLQSET